MGRWKSSTQGNSVLIHSLTHRACDHGHIAWFWNFFLFNFSEWTQGLTTIQNYEFPDSDLYSVFLERQTKVLFSPLHGTHTFSHLFYYWCFHDVPGIGSMKECALPTHLLKPSSFAFDFTLLHCYFFLTTPLFNS